MPKHSPDLAQSLLIAATGVCFFMTAAPGSAQEVRRAVPIEPFFQPEKPSPDASPASTPEPTPTPTRRAIPIPTGKPVPFDTPEPSPTAKPVPVRPAPTPVALPPATPRPTPKPTPKPTPVPTPKPALVTKPLSTPPQPASTPAPESESVPSPTPAATEPGSVPQIAPGSDRAAQRADQVQLDYANSLYARKMYEMAAPEYQRYLDLYPNAPDKQAALFRLAESNRALGNTNAAKTAYDSLLLNFGSGEFIGSAAYRLAEIYFSEQDYRAAQPLYRKACIRLKDPVVINASKFYAARCSENLKYFSDARIDYEDLVATKEQNPYREVAWFSLAKLLVDAGRKADAARQLSQLATEASKPELQAEALVRAGLLKIELGQAAQAAADLNKALKIPEIGDWKESAEVGLLHLQYDAGQYRQVVDTFTAHEADFSKQVRGELLVLAANAYRQLGQQKPAQELYSKVIAEFPDTAYATDAQYEQLVSLYSTNDPEVIQKVDDYLKNQDLKKEKRDQVTLLKAEALYKTKKYGDAIPVYESLQDSTLPDNLKAEVLYKLGWCQIQSANNEGAIKALSNFISRYPSNKNIPTALAKRGLAYQQSKNLGNALKDFNELISRFPAAKERELALEQKALILGQQQENKAMADTFRQLLKDYPRTPIAAQAHYWIGWSAYEAKNYKEAIAPLETARKLNRQEFFDRASLRLINAHYYLEDEDGLAAELDAYTKGRGKAPSEIVRWLATRFQSQKEFERAEKYFGMLVAGDGEKNSLDLLNLGNCELMQKKHTEAVKHFQAYLDTQLSPSDKATGLIALGQAQLGLGQYEEAQKSADEACIHQPEGRLNAEGRLLSGDIAFARKDFEKASKIYLSISLVFDDPNLTPVALDKAYRALSEAGSDVEAKKTLNKLQSLYPEYQVKPLVVGQ